MDVKFFSRLPSTARQRWLYLGLLVIFVLASIQYGIKASKKRSAMVRWSGQIQQLDEENIYELYNYPNPPIMALLLTPLAEMPPLVGSLCWYYLKVAMTLAALLWTFRLVESAGVPFSDGAKLATVALSLRPILGDLSHGNINLFILFLVVGALYAFRRGRDATAGLALALSIACKVTPALFLPYFVWKRSWKVLASCAVGLVLFFWVIPALALGWETNARLLDSWAENMVKPYIVSGDVFYSEHNNQSLPGFLFRMLTHSPSFTRYAGDNLVPIAYHNLASLDPTIVKWAIKAMMVGFALLVWWACRTPITSRATWQLAAEYAVVVLGMLLFSERTWKHHCVTLMLPFAVVVYYVATRAAGSALRAYLIGTLVAVVFLMSSTSTGLLEDGTAKLFQVYGAYVWANLILLAAMIVMLRVGDGAAALSSARPHRARTERSQFATGA